MNEDLLRDTLAQISNHATPVDFVDRSLARSRRISRNRAAMIAAATVVTLAIGGGVTWRLGLPGPEVLPPGETVSPSAPVTPRPPTTTPPPTTTVTPTATAPASASCSADTPWATTAGSSIAGLPGWLYYSDSSSVFRMTPDGLALVANNTGVATVSPDGTRVACIDDMGQLWVATRDGEVRALQPDQRFVTHGAAPAWSPDSQRILVARIGGANGATQGVVAIASGTFTPLASQIGGIHLLWSADGQHLGYATGTCSIGTADADGRNARIVPVFGDDDPAVNPERRRSCDPFSLSADGTLMSVNQRTGDDNDGDIGWDMSADAIVDTRTGADVPLPIPSAEIRAILFQPNGEILVRSVRDGTVTLSLLNPDRTIKTQVTESAVGTSFCPESPSTCRLLAYVPN